MKSSIALLLASALLALAAPTPEDDKVARQIANYYATVYEDVEPEVVARGEERWGVEDYEDKKAVAREEINWGVADYEDE
ncbi:hypothetical protein EKO27_g7383 [Xylaria grammica]|uniref:Uncharacterized protein n=1 Tax=Xylaria grammica TaxID=363999 RepID=A0A439CZT5_9PEZI|nr:hypothetical protein EKO27_g7383 [Xylaria grammica]